METSKCCGIDATTPSCYYKTTHWENRLQRKLFLHMKEKLLKAIHISSMSLLN